MREQELINTFIHKFRTNQDVSNEIREISAPRYRNSVILQYYLGVHYERNGNIMGAMEQFDRCLSISPYFSQPYFHLADYHIRTGNHRTARDILMRIFDKETLDATGPLPRRCYQIMEQLRIISMLFPIMKRDDPERTTCFDRMISRLRAERDWGYRHYEGWKNTHVMYGSHVMGTDPSMALLLYKNGLERRCPITTMTGSAERDAIHSTDKALLEGYCIARDYCESVFPCRVPASDVFPLDAKHKARAAPMGRRIRIGYMSPDFNKNAVGLFVAPLLKHFDMERYEVYCYYNNVQSDEFTSVLMSYPRVVWTNIAGMPDDAVYSTMAQQHRIDILFDLIGMGSGNRLDLVAMKPAPVIVNYLGYPDYTHMPAIDYRLVDAITDPDTEEHSRSIGAFYVGMGYRERLLRLPRCFCCYHLFDNVELPGIRMTRTEPRVPNEIRCAIMNKRTKWHPSILGVWRSILANNPHITLYLKLGENDGDGATIPDGFPEAQIRHVPFFEDLGSYLDFYNEIDLCLDTYPYNGTTTTCSSLVMGVPVLTVYDPRNRHVSNVSASILRHSGEPAFFVAGTFEEYQHNAGIFEKETLGQRQARRERFVAAMDPIVFMRDFEDCIEKIV